MKWEFQSINDTKKKLFPEKVGWISTNASKIKLFKTRKMKEQT